jgi:predicted glycogen debranching enzyme
MAAPRWTDLNYASRIEWLDTNRRGHYAMGTAAGLRSRRYHGLLNGPAKPDGPTFVWVNALEEVLSANSAEHLLHTEQYSGIVTPRGFESLRDFSNNPCPRWLYTWDELSLEKEVFLVENFPGVVIRYCCSENARLRLRPLLSGRPHHHLNEESPEAPFLAESSPGVVRLLRDDATLFLRGDFATYEPAPDWYFRFIYSEELARGLDHQEDLWSPGIFHLPLQADTWASLLVSLEDPGLVTPLQFLHWREEKQAAFPNPKTLEQRLANSARHYIFQRRQGPSIIAGYPWFTDWGRDTFISLPGLLLANPTARSLDCATGVIQQFLDQRQHGLIPNRITDDGATPEYNSIDATLWLFTAVHYWREAGGNRRVFRHEFYPALVEILSRLEQGTLFAIQCDPADGLLSAGNRETQLTWMDARVYGVPVTPRFGKAVEINCLWYNALRLLTDWARELADFATEKHFGQLANRTIGGFTTLFWNEQGGYLYDVIRTGYRDTRIRPNQLFALSLPYPLLVRSKAERMLAVVEEHLVTPYGLRTLSPADPQYKPRYEGGPEARDAAYHQGTVWPWLLGPYIRACLRTRGHSEDERNRCRQLIAPLLATLDEGCLHHLAEVFDGNPPHRPGGTPAQAWSLAEIQWLLRKELAS